ncbi:MAG TPA: LCP family protein [Candidatus Bathyarchaeia archaeon]|nr:LCP family protein [Candidatus Bathyarchaeia archaeon]
MVKKKDKFLSKVRRKLSRNIYLFRFLFFSLIGGAVIFALNFILPTSLRLVRSLFKEPLLLASHSFEDLRSTDGRINILFLGAGGSNHQGADLTDSIIFVSLGLENQDILMLSLPRDIWIPSMRAKINTAYHYGEKKRPGGGLVLAKSAVSEILDQPVHYAVLVNFQGFIKAIDLLGGVDIEVERSFDDYKYPIPGMENAQPEELRFEQLHFDVGWQHLDGDRALKYARSRYADGEEGTDFARSKRQQKLILALMKKVFSSKTFLSPQRIFELGKILKEYLDTDLYQEDYLSFLELALRFRQGEIRSAILDGITGVEEGYLINPPQSEKYDQQWVLVPRTGDWQEIQKYVVSLIEKKDK